MEKITLSADELYVLRSTKTALDGSQRVLYYETAAAWNTAPTRATLFTSFEIGEAHMGIVAAEFEGTTPHDGSIEVFDVVPLYGEILNSPNGTTVHINRGSRQ